MFFIILIALSFIFYLVYVLVSRQSWDIIDTPTVSPSGAMVGLCEVEGKAAPPSTPTGESMPILEAPISGYPCVWFSVKVEWYEYGKDGGWKDFRSKTSDGGFRIADKYGSIAVIPDGASTNFTTPIQQNQTANAIARAYHYFMQFPTGKDAAEAALWSTSEDGYYMWHPNLNQWIPSKFVSPDRKYYFDWVKLKWFEVAPKRTSFLDLLLSFGDDKWSNSKLRVTEVAVFPDQEIFTHGRVTISPDGTDLIFGKKGSFNENCFISTKGQDELLKKLRFKKWIALIVAILIPSFVSLIRVGSGTNYSIEIMDVTFTIVDVVANLVGLILFIICSSIFMKLFRTYNRFVRLREQVRLSRSAIDVTTKRRSSLIPELCDVIDGVMAHEKVVLDAVAKLRTREADVASKEIFALAESYPNIKSSQNFIHMQKELARTEEKIAMARSFLNDSILALDNLRATLAGMVFSPLFAKEQRPNL